MLQIIPALERIFSLVGADLRAWFAAMPRPHKLLPQKRPQEINVPRETAGAQPGPARPAAGLSATIDRYYLSRHCAVSQPSYCMLCTCKLSFWPNRLVRTSVETLLPCCAVRGTYLHNTMLTASASACCLCFPTNTHK